jgi:hypothetical protein
MAFDLKIKSNSKEVHHKTFKRFSRSVLPRIIDKGVNTSWVSITRYY